MKKVNLKKLLPLWLLAIGMSVASCIEPDTVLGNVDEFTTDELVTTLDDGTTMHFYDKHDGTVSVTYDRTNPTHLNISNKSEITTYTGKVKIPASVVIEGVTYDVNEIDAEAFMNCTTLSELTIPESVKAIGNGAFVNCKAITKLVLPAGITAIPNVAFGNCTKLATITIPGSVKTIGDNAFFGTKFKTLVIPEGVEEMGRNVFTRCTSMTELTLPSTLKTIGGGCLASASNLTKLHVKAAIPPTLTESLAADVAKTVLYVPTGSKAAYEANALWNEFTNIIEE